MRGTYRYSENSTAQIQAWIGRQKGNTVHVVMEATGGYETTFVDCLHEAEIPCSAVNAKRIKDFARSCGTLEKTEAIDAKVIARFSEVMTATAVAQLPELGQLNRGQIAKLVRVAPLANDSGQKMRTRKTYARPKFGSPSPLHGGLGGHQA